MDRKDPLIMQSTTSLYDVLGLAAAATIGAQETPTPGVGPDTLLFKHLPAHVYHADRDALSCSLLKPLLISPAHFMAGLAACERKSNARDFGSLVHLLVLQPELVGSEVAVYPGVIDHRTKAYAEFEEQHPGKLVVDEPTFANARRLAAKVRETRFRGRRLGEFIDESDREVTIYFTEPTTGLRMRVRLDIYHPDISFDLKSTRHAVARLFARDAVTLDYDLQAFMYSLGRCLYEGTEQSKPFVFIAAENDDPFSVSTFEASANFIGNGSMKFQSCAAAYKACSAADYWPDLSCEGTLDIEPWQQFSNQHGWQAALASNVAALP
jgi:hypothetical protein